MPQTTTDGRRPLHLKILDRLSPIVVQMEDSEMPSLDGESELTDFSQFTLMALPSGVEDGILRVR
jgi:hypothetical protein